MRAAEHETQRHSPASLPKPLSTWCWPSTGRKHQVDSLLGRMIRILLSDSEVLISCWLNRRFVHPSEDERTEP